MANLSSKLYRSDLSKALLYGFFHSISSSIASAILNDCVYCSTITERNHHQLYYCRKIFASHLRQSEIESQIVDLLQGRVPRTVLRIKTQVKSHKRFQVKFMCFANLAVCKCQIVQIDGKIYQTWMFLPIVGIMTLLLVVILSNNAFAQKLHDMTLDERLKQSPVLERNSQIDVGDSPVAVAVADTFIGGLGFGINTNTVYVANSFSDTVSVISGENNTKIKDIPVGDSPVAIGLIKKDIIRNDKNTIYVANSERETLGFLAKPSTISVISGENNTKIKDIPVGDNPEDIGINEDTNTVYVVNMNSSGISVIDSVAHKVVAGVTFRVNPFNSGYVICNELTTPSPTEQYIYTYSGDECIAKPNEGFGFVSWEENLEGNSTQLIRVSRSASPWDSFVLAISGFFGSKPDEPEATLKITKFGSFTANFKELPPAVPSEYWIPLYGIIISTIVGWSIPSIIGWTKSKADARKLNYYHKQITSLYGDGKVDGNDIEALNRIRTSILDAHAKGKINDKHYEILRNEISILYEKIFRKRIDDSLNNNSPANDKTTQEQLNKIRNEVKYAYSEGKINDKHYDLLNKDIIDWDSKER